MNHVNFQVRVPGFSEPFKTKDMRFDTRTNTLYIKAPEVVAFYDDDEIRVEVMDLDLPVEMRLGLANGGWLEMAMFEFISILRLAYSLED